MIIVVNKYKHKPTLNDVYIGRGSILGNPYSHLKSSKAKIFVESRDKAIECYKNYLYKIINNEKKSDEMLLLGLIFRDKYLSELQKIKELAEKQDVYLICFCAPQSCHGDIIKKIVESYIEEQKDFI